MTTPAIDALHHVHTATNDLLKGFREMTARAEPDIQPVIRRLTDMHERHAAEQEAALARLHDAGAHDSSLQGTVNVVVVTVRDWLTHLDKGVLPSVRQGEEAVRNEYNKTLQDGLGPDSAAVTEMLTSQRDAINLEIARLPEH